MSERSPLTLVESDKLVSALEQAREALASVTDDTDGDGHPVLTADTDAIQVALSSVNKALAAVKGA